ncbi:hypothetical protein R3P38DRAFT_2847157 [Favolaschia claudopus]|uniref:Uncharacterized protein n=1 Tax=Favolaschia claudopus TaxID=2862362 RepID=A0AAW0DRF3_9AGAR
MCIIWVERGQNVLLRKFMTDTQLKAALKRVEMKYIGVLFACVGEHHDVVRQATGLPLIPIPSTRVLRTIAQLSSTLDDLEQFEDEWISQHSSLLEDKIDEYTKISKNLRSFAKRIRARPKRTLVSNKIRLDYVQVSDQADALAHEIKTTSERIRHQRRLVEGSERELDLSQRASHRLLPPPPPPLFGSSRLGVARHRIWEAVKDYDTTRLRYLLSADGHCTALIHFPPEKLCTLWKVDRGRFSNAYSRKSWTIISPVDICLLLQMNDTELHYLRSICPRQPP